MNAIDANIFTTIGHRTRAWAEPGKNDITWMPNTVTVLVIAASTGQALFLIEDKPGTTLNFGDLDAGVEIPKRTQTQKIDIGNGLSIDLQPSQLISGPSGSIGNTWEGKRDNLEPLQYTETVAQAAAKQLKGETGKHIDTATLINLGYAYVKPANMSTRDYYYAIILPDEFVPASEGIDPTIKGGHWIPLPRAYEMLRESLIEHDPICQALLRYKVFQSA